MTSDETMWATAKVIAIIAEQLTPAGKASAAAALRARADDENVSGPEARLYRSTADALERYAREEAEEKS